MENLENKEQNESSFIASKEINGYLIEISKWGKFLAIVGFVGLGIVIIMSIIAMVSGSFISHSIAGGFSVLAFGIFYLIIGALYFFPTYYLYQFSVEMKQGIYSEKLSKITSGFRNLKSLFKYFGILTIVVLSFYVLILLFAIPSSIFFLINN